MISRAVIFIIVLALSTKTSSAAIGEKECSKFDFQYHVLEKIISLENKNAELQRQQTIFERSNEDLVEVVKALRKNDENEDEDIQNLKSSLMKLTNQTNNAAERDNLRKDLETKDKAHYKALEEMKLTFEQKDKSQDEDIGTLKTSLVSLINHTNSDGNRKRVLTLAQLPRITLGNKQITKFSIIVYNIGDAYNPTTGIFTAPSKGTYIFAVKFCMSHTHRISAAIMRGTATISKVMAGENQSQSCSSDTVVVQLNPGEEISVKTTSMNGGFIADPNYGITSFTGALINWS